MIENPFIIDLLITFLVVATIVNNPTSCIKIPVKTPAAKIKNWFAHLYYMS